MTRVPSPAELLLLPYERSVSYGGGTAAGPGAVLELLDRRAVAAVTTVEDRGGPPEEYLSATAAAATAAVRAGRAPAAVGGEHTVTFGVLSGLLEAGLRPDVLQLDAHADLRDEYEGSRWSHACVMRRVADDLGLPALGAAIRSLSAEEASWLRESGRMVLHAGSLRREGPAAAAAAARKMSRDVYLTVDIDFLDPAVVPGTGTPEPGGLSWYEGLDLIDTLLQDKHLLGFDLVELSPALEAGVSPRAAVRLVEYLLHRL